MKKSLLKKLIVTSVLLAGIVFGTKVEASNQGPYIKDGSMVQVTKKNYDMWQNFGWKKKSNTNNVYQKTFQARGRYQHKNGQIYYSLFDSKGKWYGYLNSTATKKTSRQGSYLSDGSYVKITKQNYEMWQNFGWKLKNNTNNVYGQTFQAKARYHHFNGSTYYSLYDNKGTWYGYLNAGATQKTNPQGNYISDGRYVQITKNYELWQNFGWKKKGNGATYYNQGLQARGRYQHFNGQTYYSLFNDKGTWLGYINANATIVTGGDINDYQNVGGYAVGEVKGKYSGGLGNSGLFDTTKKGVSYKTLDQIGFRSGRYDVYEVYSISQGWGWTSDITYLD